MDLIKRFIKEITWLDIYSITLLILLIIAFTRELGGK